MKKLCPRDVAALRRVLLSGHVTLSISISIIYTIIISIIYNIIISIIMYQQYFSDIYWNKCSKSEKVG